MDARTLNHLVREIFPDYDIHKRTGIPDSLVIPTADVATQIVRDVVDRGKFLIFVALLIQTQDQGFMGRQYPIPRLREIIRGTYELGYMFDSVNRIFVEDPRHRRTRNWGVLEEEVEYQLAFLCIDIAGNTRLVKNHPEEVIERTYADLRETVTNTITKRNGRVWSWEGDGGLVAFYFGDKNTGAVLSAMEIQHELFIYNRIRCRLNSPLKVRIGVHSGHCEYTDNTEDLEKMETVKESEAVQRSAKAGAVSITIVVKMMLDELVAAQFTPIQNAKNANHSYVLKLE